MNVDPDIAWEIAKWAVASLSASVSGVGIWLLKKYGSDRAMLLKHDQTLTARESELGQFKVVIENIKRGPYGEELEEKLEALHKRVTLRRKAHEQLSGDMREVKADIKWLCKHAGREDDDK